MTNCKKCWPLSLCEECRERAIKKAAKELAHMPRPNHNWRECNQCGAKPAEDHDPNDNRCPNHAMPEPYASCDGTLTSSSVRDVCYTNPVDIWWDVDMLIDPPV